MATNVTETPGARAAARVEAVPAGLSLRRWALVAAPVLAGVLAIAGAVADPAAGEDGRVLWEAYAADPARVQWKSFLYHFSYLFWGAAALFTALLVRGRGVWIANIAAVLALLGITTMPGFVAVDFFDSALGRVAGIDTVARVDEVIGAMWSLPLMAGTGSAGFILALPVAAAAVWRARLVPWWAPVAVLAGQVAWIASGVTVWGAVVLAACFAAFAAALARIPRLSAARTRDAAARSS